MSLISKHIILLILTTIFHISCTSHTAIGQQQADSAGLSALRMEIGEFIKNIDGKVGVAVITSDKDTLTLNNRHHYPMMSVFKLHQALAIAHYLDNTGVSIDSLITIKKADLNPDTWSPLYKEMKADCTQMSIRELITYTLQLSDNNASNIMFDRIMPVSSTDSFIRQTVKINDFAITCTEADMQWDHNLSHNNWSTPLACAILIDKVTNDSLVSSVNQHIIREILHNCQTGLDRLAAPLQGKQGVKIAHKTGSGYRDKNGFLLAHNDIGAITLPDGRVYSIAVLITAFNGSETEAAKIIAGISEIVFRYETHLK